MVARPMPGHLPLHLDMLADTSSSHLPDAAAALGDSRGEGVRGCQCWERLLRQERPPVTADTAPTLSGARSRCRWIGIDRREEREHSGIKVSSCS